MASRRTMAFDHSRLRLPGLHEEIDPMIRRRQFIERNIAVVAGSLVGPAVASGWSASRKGRLSSEDPKIRSLLASMTLEEKIGQMTQAEQNALKDEADIGTY